jgi:hypothetical protein
MATKHPRVQVTIDPELAQALAAVDRHPKSRAGLIRDLALRGAEVVKQELSEEATEFFLKVARGEIDIDLTGAQEAWEEREAEVE